MGNNYSVSFKFVEAFLLDLIQDLFYLLVLIIQLSVNNFLFPDLHSGIFLVKALDLETQLTLDILQGY